MIFAATNYWVFDQQKDIDTPVKRLMRGVMDAIQAQRNQRTTEHLNGAICCSLHATNRKISEGPDANFSRSEQCAFASWTFYFRGAEDRQKSLGSVFKPQLISTIQAHVIDRAQGIRLVHFIQGHPAARLQHPGGHLAPHHGRAARHKGDIAHAHIGLGDGPAAPH